MKRIQKISPLLLCTLLFSFSFCDIVSGAAGLSIGNPVPALCPGVVSRISIIVDQAEDPSPAGFDVIVSFDSTVNIHSVNSGTEPPGLLPRREEWHYDESGITLYLPLKGATGDPLKNESSLGPDFIRQQGADGVLELKNEALSGVSARLAFAYQSKDGAVPLISGTLVTLYLYIGSDVQPGTTVQVSLTPSEDQKLAAFDGVPVIPALISGCTSAVFYLGDVNRDTFVDLKDAILILKFLGRKMPGEIQLTDIDRDGVTSMPEAIFIMQLVSELRD